MLMMIIRAGVSGGLEFLPSGDFLLFSNNRLLFSSVSHYLLSSIALNLTFHPYCSFPFICQTHQNFLEAWHVKIWHLMTFVTSAVAVDLSLLSFSNPQLPLAPIIIIKTLEEITCHFPALPKHQSPLKKQWKWSISTGKIFPCMYLHQEPYN